MYTRILAGALALMLGAAAPALAQSDPMVGGAAMSAHKSIVANAGNSKDHTILVSLVKKAGLVATLSGPGPFTVFAPTNEAFAKIPKATLDAVGGNKALLTKVLTYHVVAGKLDNAGFLDYRVPVASDMPMIEAVLVEVPNPSHPYGAKGVGEVNICPPMAAIGNAIERAVGVRMTELPMSPPRVLAALDAGQLKAAE